MVKKKDRILETDQYKWAIKRKVRAHSGGKALFLTLPKDFTEVLGLKANDDVKILYGDKILTLSKVD